MAKVGPIGVHAGPTLPGAPPATPSITNTVDGGDGSSVVVSITGTDTIRLYYRLLHVDSWTTGLTRSGSGDITQTGLSSGKFYEFYCVADDGTMVSAPSNVATQRISGTAAKDSALSRSPALVLVKYIINELSLMSAPSDRDSWPLYVANTPDGVDVETNCGTVYDTAGVLDGKLMNGEVIRHPGAQLRIRSRDFTTGYAKIEKIALALDDVNWDTMTINGDTYQLQNISRATPIIPLGLERGTKRRFLFTVNFLVSMKKL